MSIAQQGLDKTSNVFVNASSEEKTKSQFETYLRIVEHEFPLEFLIAGELAQFETFAIPSISKLLHRTKQYEDDGVKRLDDTRATLYAIFVNPEGNKEREQMVEHLNWVHSHYAITNDDNIYTLLRMFFNPIELIQNHGWRHLTLDELDAMCAEMVKIGKAMNIDLPSEDMEELYTWQEEYRRQHQVYSDNNKAVALGTMKAIKEHFPSWMHGLIDRLARGLLADADLLNALGLKKLSRTEKVLTFATLKVWQGLSKLYRPWKKQPFSASQLANTYPSYPNQRLDLRSLGPKKLVTKRNKTSGCPFH